MGIRKDGPWAQCNHYHLVYSHLNLVKEEFTHILGVQNSIQNGKIDIGS